QIARAGFAILQPVSVIEEAVAQDTSSPVAMGREIARKNEAVPPPPWALRLALPLVPAALMAFCDPRRRPALPASAYGVAGFAAQAWLLATLPAYGPLVPRGLETAAALALTVVYAAAGGVAGRGLAAQLVRDEIEPRVGRERAVVAVTSPGR